MNELFSPAMILMDRLRFPAKFTVLSIIVLVPLMIMSIVIIKQFQSEVRHLENERKGLAYVKFLRLPVEHIQQHRGMTSAYKNGAEQFKNRIFSKRQDIDGYFSDLIKIDRELSGDLHTQGLVGNLASQWESIKAHSFDQDWPATLKAHNALIGDMLALFEHVANASGIVLDQKLDSYHLGNSITEVLPQMIEFMGQARAAAAGIAAGGSLNPAKLPELLTLISNIEIYKQHLEKGLKVAEEDNRALGSAINAANEHYRQSLAVMLNMLQQQIIDSTPITISSEKVFDTSTAAISASFQLYDQLLENLDQLFLERSRSAEQYLNMTAVGSVLVVFAVIYLLIGLSFSINRSVTAINAGTKRLAGNDFTARIDIRASDEMGEIAQSFNTMTESLSAFILTVIDTGNDLQKASKEVYDVAHQTANAVEHQRRETSSVAIAINEMSATIQDVAKTTNDAADAAMQAD